ncbi:hypothetical protein M426DRAFT_9037 [Hypoxylon sp. CI-4A]|nr:hypothetical protein M426DRAFT_9037 [Hypoxylon sp. CI-4A]
MSLLASDEGMVWYPDHDIHAQGKHKLSQEEKLYILPLVSRPIIERGEDSDIRIRFYPGKTRVETVYLVLKRAKPASDMPVFERVGWAEYTGFDWNKVPDLSKAQDTKFMIV